jgi:hypothetical protein
VEVQVEDFLSLHHLLDQRLLELILLLWLQLLKGEEEVMHLMVWQI